MRVLMTNDLPPGRGGGAEIYLERLVAALRARGDEVEVFVPARPREGAARVLDMWDPLSRRRLAAVARAFRPDVVHHHNVARELSVSVLTAAVGAPTVMTVHDGRLAGAAEPNVPGLRALVDRHVKRPLDVAVARRHVDVAIAVSRPLATALTAAGFARVEHIPPAVPPARATPQPVTANRDVLVAARLTPDKGVDVLVEAFARVVERLPDARLYVAGDGPLLPALRARALRAVRLLGTLEPDALERLMATVRVVAVPSVGPEGSPLVAAEGARLGRALLLSDTPGVADVADLLGQPTVPRGRVGELSAALERLLDDDTAAEASAARAAHRSDQFAEEIIVGRIRDLYARLADRRAATVA